jgi:hypothetical protein
MVLRHVKRIAQALVRKERLELFKRI